MLIATDLFKNSDTLLDMGLIALSAFFLGLTIGFVCGRLYTKSRLKTQAKQIPSSTKINPPVWHLLTTEQALLEQQTNPDTGLSETVARERQSLYGLNQLTEKPPRSTGHLLLSQFKSFLIMVLIAAAILATAIGDIKDGIVIIVVVVINALLGFYQEFQAEKSLAALKKMLALQAKVCRNGKIIEILAEQLVPGDIVILEAGDKIPADGRIVDAHALAIDQSSLTGESLPVAKQHLALTLTHTPLAERSNLLYMNTAVTRGRAKMLVTATGMDTEIGKLATLLAQAEDGATPLQTQLDSLGKRLAILALAVVLVLFGSALWRGEPIIETAFTAIALAVAAIPEGLPAVVTVTLALGMHRMAKQRAIVKRLAAVETLGCTTVICTDKTGTLTVNQMTVRSVYCQSRSFHVSGTGYQVNGAIVSETGGSSGADLNALLQPIVLCNNSHLDADQVIGDPLEGALLVLAAKGGITEEQVKLQFPRIAEIPFDATYKLMATFHRHTNSDEVTVFIKGAPEVLLKKCQFALDANHQIAPVNHVAILMENERMASTGLRVLAVATRSVSITDFQANDDLFEHIEALTFIGLVGLMDPPRAEAQTAIMHCKKAGIAVKMITGDQKITALAIAREIGLVGEVIDGEELAEMDDDTLNTFIGNIAVFARTAPEQKVRIVNVLKAEGQVVAMTGDGVNDAPALKSADIGIAMGMTGTDVAKEAATMILTDDNFATIVTAIKEGRGIYENMVKFIRFQLSTNIGAIVTVALAPLFSMPIPFTAVQLLWINIIMDGPPAMSLGIDPCRTASMNEVPRDPSAQILSWRRLSILLTYGLTMAAGTLGILYHGLKTHEITHATTLAFTTFVLFQIFNVFNARAEKGSAFNRHFFANRYFWLAILGVLLMQVVVINWLPAQTLFHTTALTSQDWLLAVGVASSVLVFEESRKLLGKAVRMLWRRGS